MACIVNEYIVQIRRVRAVDSCVIGDNIWFVWKTGVTFRMSKWNIYTKEAETIESKNPEILWHENRSRRKDFLLAEHNGKLMMLVKDRRNGMMFEFDTLTLEWRKLIDGSVELPPLMNGLIILDDEIIGNCENDDMERITMYTMDMDKFEVDRKIYQRNFILSMDTQFVKMNGKLYFIEIGFGGIRNLFRFDKQENQFETIKRDGEQQFLMTSEDFNTFTWSANNKIYQAVPFKEIFTMDCFDETLGTWRAKFRAPNFFGKVVNVHGDDRNVYIICKNNEHVSVRMLSFLPTLQSLALIKLVEMQSGEETTSRMTEELKKEFDGMVAMNSRDRKTLSEMKFINYRIVDRR